MMALRYGMNQFFADPETDDNNRLFFALSSYNAGPDRIQRLRGEAAASGRNLNKWFGNIDKHYLACGLLHQQERGHLRALGESRPDGG